MKFVCGRSRPDSTCSYVLNSVSVTPGWVAKTVGGKDEWLLIKTGEDAKSISAKRDDESVLSKRTMAQIAGQRTRTWQSNRASASASKPTFKERIARAVQKRAAATPPSRARAKPVKSARRRRPRAASKPHAALSVAVDR